MNNLPPARALEKFTYRPVKCELEPSRQTPNSHIKASPPQTLEEGELSEQDEEDESPILGTSYEEMPTPEHVSEDWMSLPNVPDNEIPQPENSSSPISNAVLVKEERATENANHTLLIKKEPSVDMANLNSARIVKEESTTYTSDGRFTTMD